MIINNDNELTSHGMRRLNGIKTFLANRTNGKDSLYPNSHP